MRKNKSTRAKRAKANATKQMTNVVSVESMNTTDVVTTKTEAESGKVSSKDVLKAASSIRAAVKEVSIHAPHVGSDCM